MRIGLIDVDNRNKKKVSFPNLSLMKISAFHKAKGDIVEWYDGSHFDKVYISKVFSFSEDVGEIINADEVIRGGSGYAIKLIDGKEYYDKSFDKPLPCEIDHIYPDYDLYGIKDIAYGFLQKGCPRRCSFCHVEKMQGSKPYRFAQLSEFWRGQKNIVLLDPNITATKECLEIFKELIDSGAKIDFTQGLDIRCMTREKAEMLCKMKIKSVHFAFDNYDDWDWIVPKLKEFKEVTGWGRHKVTVYVLTNFNTTIEQDLERIMAIRELNFQPYVMRYDKEHIKRGSEINALARWVNFVPLFWKYNTFEEYKKYNRK